MTFEFGYRLTSESLYVHNTQSCLPRAAIFHLITNVPYVCELREKCMKANAATSTIFT